MNQKTCQTEPSFNGPGHSTLYFLVFVLSLFFASSCSDNAGDDTNGDASSTDGGSDDGNSARDTDTLGDGGTDEDSGTDGDSDGDGDSDTDTDSDSDSDSDGDSDTQIYPADGGLDGGDVCVSDIVDCTILCGRIKDTCTTDIHDCGGCDNGLVCDVVFNLCVPPLVTCEDLEADCGAIRNSCGVRLECGYCEDDQECNPDTNKCIICTNPTCQDLGHECGMAWNGCGTSANDINKNDCTDCTNGMVCNSSFKLCEPDCVPETSETICMYAELEQGVECGWISDGCGGLTDCGDDCPEGEACGVRGVANRCDEPERPLECVILGWECGTFDSACSGEQNCGDCPEGEVCNDNHICGPPCEMVTCEDAYTGQCGQQLDDGCGGRFDCLCGANLVCNATLPGETGTCETLSTCSDYTTGGDGQPCSNGASPAFPRGDDVNLSCPCPAGVFCIDGAGAVVSGEDTGTCCTNTNSCDGTHCSTTNSCTNVVSDDCCDEGTQWCNASDECINRLLCEEIYYDNPSPPPDAGLADGTQGAPCSNVANQEFDDGSGDLLACPCDWPLFCVGGLDSDTPGYCCENDNSCDDTHLFDESCNVPNSCPGGPELDCCNWNECCVASACEEADECDNFTDGGLGHACSRNRHFEACPAESTTHPSLRCSCGSGLCCDQPDGNLEGVCIPSPEACDGDVTCSVWDECRDRDNECCDGDEFCDTASDVCVERNTCDGDDFEFNGLEPDGDQGDPCSDDTDTQLPVGDGTFLSCPCDTPPGWGNSSCEVDGTSSLGNTCQCTPTVCHCGNTGQNNGCGGTLGCPCPPGTPVCNTSVSPPVCCAHYQCPTGKGGECGIAHPSCGTTITCGCPDQYETCGGKGVPNQCGCTPDTCRGRSGTYDDLCGGNITCDA